MMKRHTPTRVTGAFGLPVMVLGVLVAVAVPAAGAEALAALGAALLVLGLIIVGGSRRSATIER